MSAWKFLLILKMRVMRVRRNKRNTERTPRLEPVRARSRYHGTIETRSMC